MNIFRLNWQLGKQFSLKMPVPIWSSVLERRDINGGIFVYFSKRNINPYLTNVENRVSS